MPGLNGIMHFYTAGPGPLPTKGSAKKAEQVEGFTEVRLQPLGKKFKERARREGEGSGAGGERFREEGAWTNGEGGGESLHL